MFTCCGQRERGSSQKSSSATNPNAQPTATTNEALPATSPAENAAISESSPHQNEQADSTQPSISVPEFDLNSSYFMPDPAKKKKPSPFEVASASYAEATDFGAGKEHLPALGEGEEEEGTNPREGKHD